MNRSESIMLTYFEDKASYIAFKLAHNMVVEKNVSGWQNTVLKVLDENGDLCCYDGKPSVIDTGRTNHDQGGVPIYSISWLTGDPMLYNRPRADGPAYIDARGYPKQEGGKGILFQYMENGLSVPVTKGQVMIDQEKHFSTTHKKATGISREKFVIGISSPVV